MTANVLTDMLATMSATYRWTYKDCPQETMDLMMNAWFESLRDYTDEEVIKAFRICLKKCKTPPTIADIVDKVEKARDLKRPSKAEVWEQLLHAVDKTKKCVYVEDRGYRTLYQLKNDECKAIFGELPQSVRKWVGFDTFCTYAEKSSTALDVERARFMKEIDEIRETIREYKQIATNELLQIKG